MTNSSPIHALGKFQSERPDLPLPTVVTYSAWTLEPDEELAAIVAFTDGLDELPVDEISGFDYAVLKRDVRGLTLHMTVNTKTITLIPAPRPAAPVPVTIAQLRQRAAHHQPELGTFPGGDAA